MARKPRQDLPELPLLQDTVRLTAEGFAKVLGDLEARLMEKMWKLGYPATARTVHREVVDEHPVALLTVVTVLNKLVDKKLLRREKVNDILHYEPCWTEEELRTHVARRLVDGILSFGPAAFAASFIDALAEQDPRQLEEMERLIQARLHGQEEA